MRIAIIGRNKNSNTLGIHFVSNKISDALHRTALQRGGFIRTIIETLRQSGSVSLTDDTDGPTRNEAVKATARRRSVGKKPISGPICVTSGVR